MEPQTRTIFSRSPAASFCRPPGNSAWARSRWPACSGETRRASAASAGESAGAEKAPLCAQGKARHLPAHVRRAAASRSVRLQARAGQVERQTVPGRISEGPALRLHLGGAEADGHAAAVRAVRQRRACGCPMPSRTCTSVADDLCVIKSLNTDQFNHAPAELLLFTGSPRSGPAVDGFLGDVWAGQRERESARLCGADFERRSAQRRAQRLGQRLPAFGLPGRAMPLQRRSGAVRLRSARDGPRPAAAHARCLARPESGAGQERWAIPKPPRASPNTNWPTACRSRCPR